MLTCLNIGQHTRMYYLWYTMTSKKYISHMTCVTQLFTNLSFSLAIPRERVWWSESSKMMMIMMMSKFMLDECAGGCKGRLLIDIFDHTHCTNMMYCLQCRCHFLGSFAALSSVPPWWFVSAPGLQLPYAMCVASKLGHLLCFPIGAPFHISSGWHQASSVLALFLSYQIF